ncbi:hypothetical protein [Aquimarina agarilytica]|uniref:hypothetical protein n=1 Tax=Aquimarina agarilytica TaxID=1087449 RepID=UPI000287B8F4|nr:hypothetical protein [Aquimarina agarilytica]
MLQNEFEKVNKEMLEARSIQPSVDAWDRLSKRLDDDQQNKHKQYKRKYWWLGIAASLIGALFITQQFLYSDFITRSTDVDIVVTENKDIDHLNRKKILKTTTLVTEKQEFNIDSNKSVKHKTALVNREEKSSKKEAKKLVVLNVVPKEKVMMPSQVAHLEKKDTVLKGVTFQDQKIKELLVEVDALEETEVVLSNEIIEDLLLKAQIEIDIENSQIENKETVNASSLLKSVENDLDMSFRNKVLKALKENYSKVKTGIVQRRDD